MLFTMHVGSGSVVVAKRFVYAQHVFSTQSSFAGAHSPLQTELRLENGEQERETLHHRELEELS